MRKVETKPRLMRVGLDISPITSSHQVRGIGFYTQRLRDSLKKMASLTKNFTLVEFQKNSKQKVDLIHIPYFNPFFLTLPLIKPAKTVVTIHDLIPLKFPNHFPPGLKGECKWFLQRLALSGVKAIITDSLSSKEDIINLTDTASHRIFPIYLAADPAFKVIHNQRYLERLRKRFGLPKKFVLYVGDLNWNKNVMMLAQACVKQEYPLVVVGKQGLLADFDRKHKENQALLKFKNYSEKHKELILKLGFVPTEDLAGVYNLATCYAHPSFAEGFGLPILEAMASACPVVTSQSTSLAEIAQGAALLVNPEKPSELRRALASFWQKPGMRKRYITLGLKQVKKFSWEKTAQATYEIYQKVYQGEL